MRTLVLHNTHVAAKVCAYGDSSREIYVSRMCMASTYTPYTYMRCVPSVETQQENDDVLFAHAEYFVMDVDDRRWIKSG